MTGNHRQSAPLSAKDRFQLFSKIIDGIFGFLNTACKCGGIVGVAYCIYLSVDSLAGKTTITNLLLAATSNEHFSKSVLALCSLTATVWGIAERRLRQSAIKRLSEKNRELERIIDTQRTSSGLTQTGKTNPQDIRT